VKTALTVLGVALSPFVLVAAALLASTPLSWSGTAYVLGAATLTAGLALAKKRAGPWLRWAALALVNVLSVSPSHPCGAPISLTRSRR
jgi:hypothetical protein